MTSMDTGAIMVTVTAPDKETAAALAGALVKKRLAACAQVCGPIRSFYRWQGQLHDDPEYLIIIKTTSELFPGLEAAIIEQHPYEVPEIVAVPITQAHEPYLNWIRECVL